MLKRVTEKLSALKERKTLLRYFGIFAVSVLLCGVKLFGSVAPVGVCYQGSFSGRRRMAVSFLGVVAGSCVFGISPVKYIAASLIVLIMNEAFMNIANIRNRIYSAMSVTGAVGLIGLITLISPNDEKAGLLYIAELCVCVMLSVLFSRKKTPLQTSGKRGGTSLSLLITLALVLSVIPDFGGEVFSFSVGRVFVSALTLIAASRAGIYGGVVVGLVGGLVFDLSGSSVPVWSYTLALGGLGAGVVVKKKRFAAPLVFLAMGAGARLMAFRDVMYFSGAAEILVGCLIACMVPERFKKALFDTGEDNGSERCLQQIRNRIAAKLAGMSEAYEAMADTYSEDRRENSACTGEKGRFGIFEKACADVCAFCEMKNHCWCENAGAMRSALENSLESIMARGRASASDFGEGFDCARIEDFCDGITETLKEKRREMISNGTRYDEDMRVRRQYRTISEILDGSAEEIGEEPQYERGTGMAVKRLIASYGAEGDVLVYRDARGVLRVEICAEDITALSARPEELTEEISEAAGCLLELPVQTVGKEYSCLSFKERARFDCSVGATAEKRNGESVSGDCGTYFKNEDGSMFIILCDGMGSGEMAHEHAKSVMKLCESFLRAGVPPLNSAEIVSSSLEQHDRGAGAATLDITVIDPYSSVLTSVKYGAAPTYIRHRTADGRYSLSKICAGGGGGELYAVAEASTELKDGDMVIMVSDGAETGVSLEKAIVGVMTDDPIDLCDILMRMLPGGAADDRTVIAVNYFARGRSSVYEKGKI